MNETEFNQKTLNTENNLKLKNKTYDNLFNMFRPLPIIKHEKEKKTNNKNFNNLISLNKDKTLINFYKSIQSNNRPLDSFPENCQNERFIILNIKTNINSEKGSCDDRSPNIISINAMEMINMELTGIQFHAYFNNENDNEISMNENKSCIFYLSDYFIGRKGNNKKLLQSLLSFIGKSMIICHNVLFILDLINSELKKYKLPEIPINKCICTLRMMRLKNFKNTKNKMEGFQLYDLFKYYGINIKENKNNEIMNIIAFSICVTKIIHENVDNNILNNDENNTNNQNYQNEITDSGMEYHNELEQKNDFSKSDNIEIIKDPERSIKDKFKINYNYLEKNKLLELPQNNYKLFNIIQKNMKEFDRKNKIAKSYGKYKFISEKTDNCYKTIINENNDKNNLLLNNFTSNNFSAKKNMYNQAIFKNITTKLENMS